MAKGIPAGLRKLVYERDGWWCRYCGTITGRDHGALLRTIDHVIPRVLGGLSTLENCVVACFGCNHRKAHRLLEDTDLLLRPPPAAAGDPWTTPPVRPSRPRSGAPVPGARWCDDHDCWHWPTDPLPPLRAAELF